MDLIFPLLGIALCAIVLVQMGLWTAHGFAQLKHNRKQFELARELLRKQLESAGQTPAHEPAESGSWNGFRRFRVDRISSETSNCKSVYLVPEDGKPIASFRPGQHLTFRLKIPGQPDPVVRCYSLSEGPGKGYYRISVKKILPPKGDAGLPAGRASSFINDALAEGDVLEVKQPSGAFCLDEANGREPVVLMAGGIGITPMISMVDFIVQQNVDRPVVLAYGVDHGGDHAFKSYLRQSTQLYPNVRVITCYSQPRAEDQRGKDFDVEGFVTVDLIKEQLPNQNDKCRFYLCGPPPFMESLYDGLLQWGINIEQINYEAFGPATIAKAQRQKPSTKKAAGPKSIVPVKFAATGVTVDWNPGLESILELAEQHGVDVDSGCRAGSCGTCATELLSGKIEYPVGHQPDCDTGQCLVCIGKPDGPVELDL